MVKVDVRKVVFSDLFCFLLLVLLRVIEFIFSDVDKHIESGDLVSVYRMSALPNLCEHFVKLINFLVI